MHSANTDGKSQMTGSQAQIAPGIFAIVVSYAFFAALWILLSDRAMGLLFSAPETLVQASMAKGWFFVAVTSLLLYVLVRRFVGRLDAAHRRDLEHQRAQKQAPPMLVAIVEASPDAIFAKDERGRYLLFNDAAARFVGKPAAEVLGKDDRNVWPPDQAERIMAIESRVRESGQRETTEDVVDTTGGPTVFLSTRGPLRGADGQIFGTYGISRDITERKRAEGIIRNREARLHALVSASADVVYRMNADWTEMHHLVGRDFIADVAKPSREWLNTCIHPDDQHDVLSAIGDAIRTKSNFRLEHRIIRIDGSLGWTNSQAVPILDSEGEISEWIGMASDVTQRKLAEAELRRRNQELEHFNRAATDRELRMIALKREVNDMARAAGRAAPYDTSFADTP